MGHCRHLLIPAVVLMGLGLGASSVAAGAIDGFVPLWLLAPTMAPGYTVTRLPLGGSDLGNLGLNASGQVFGQSATASNPPQYLPVLWDDGKLTDLGTPDFPFGQPLLINNAGQVAGISLSKNMEASRVFLWDNGVVHDLGTLGGLTSRATGINDAGQVIGDAQLPSYAHHAFLWENGTMTDLGTLGGEHSYPFKINAAGQVVGQAWTGQHLRGLSVLHAFLWEKGSMIDLNNLLPNGAGLTWGEAESINDRGQIVVSEAGSGPVQRDLLTPSP